MLSPLLKPERPPFGDSIWLNALALVAVGMFIGHWVIAPAISYGLPDREPLRSATFERHLIDEASKRPDPFPYRTPTPVFDASGSTNYALMAKQRAQASSSEQDRTGSAMIDPDAFGELREPENAPRRSYAPRMDRHTGVMY